MIENTGLIDFQEFCLVMHRNLDSETSSSTYDNCECGNIFRADSRYCRRCGKKRPRKEYPEGIARKLTSLRVAGFGLGDRVGVALGRCISHLDVYLQEVNLSNNGFGTCLLSVDALSIIMQSLESQEYLQHMDFSRNKFSKLANDSLAELLAPSIDRNNIIIRRHMSQTLETLNLSNCNIKSGTISKILDRMSTNHFPKIHHIDISNNDLSQCENSLSLLVQSNLQSLTSINIAWARVGGHEALAMAKALACNSSITKLDLCQNNFGASETIDLLSDSLQNSEALTHLDLSYNNIDEKSACVLAHGFIAHRNVLKVINLSGNPVGQIGAREIFIEAFGNPNQRDAILESCAIESGIQLIRASKPSVIRNFLDFNKEFPDAHYEVDLSAPVARLLAKCLLRRAPLQQAVPNRWVVQGWQGANEDSEQYMERAKAVNLSNPIKDVDKKITLNKSVPFDSNAASFYTPPMLRLVKKGGEEVYEKTSEGELPREGLLKFRYIMQQPLASRDLENGCYQHLVHQLKKYASHSNYRTIHQIISSIASNYGLKSQEARTILDFSDDFANAFHIDMISLFIAKIKDKENLSLLIDKLNALDQRQAERKLGDYFHFNKFNCTGHYRLHLNREYDRLLLVELAAVNRSERRVCIRERRPDLSQHKNYEYLRNVTFTSMLETVNEETGQVELMKHQKDIIYKNNWEIPDDGIFECDFVSPIRPPDDAEPVEDDMFDDFIESYVDIQPVEANASDEELRELFDQIDEDGGGTLDAMELKKVFNLLGFSLTKEEIEHLIAQVDKGEADEKEDEDRNKEENGDTNEAGHSDTRKENHEDDTGAGGSVGKDDDDESGDGEVDFEEFRDLWDLFNHEMALRDRMSRIRNNCVSFYVEAEQLKRILSYFHSPKERIEIYIIFYSRLLDEENMHKALEMMGGTLEKPPRPPDLGKGKGKKTQILNKKLKKAYSEKLQAWEIKKSTWERDRKMELDELKRRLGPLCMFNPWHPDGEYTLKLSESNDHLVARMLIKIAANEGPGYVLSEQFYGAKQADMGFSLGEKWINEGPPKLGEWKVKFKSRKSRSDYPFRMKICEDFLGWEFPEDQSFPGDSGDDESENNGDAEADEAEDEIKNDPTGKTVDEIICSLSPLSKYKRLKESEALESERSLEETLNFVHGVYLHRSNDIAEGTDSSFLDCVFRSLGSTDEKIIEQLVIDLMHYGKDHAQISIFLKITGLHEERHFSYLSGGLMCLLLTRAFKKNSSKLIGAFKEEKIQIPLYLAIAMVIGPQGSRYPPKDADDSTPSNHRATWNCPQLWRVANDMQIESLVEMVEGLAKNDDKVVFLGDVIETVMAQFFVWYEKAIQSLEIGWEHQKVSEIHFDHFVAIMKDHNVSVPTDSNAAHERWIELRKHVGCLAGRGIDRPEIFAVGACQLGLLPNLPQFGDLDGHNWEFAPTQADDDEAQQLRNDLLRMMHDGTIAARTGNHLDTDSSDDSDGDSDFEDTFRSVPSAKESTLLWSGTDTLQMSKKEKRRMSFLWGGPLSVPDEKAKVLPEVENVPEPAAKKSNGKKHKGKVRGGVIGGRKRRTGIVGKTAVGSKKKGGGGKRKSSDASKISKGRKGSACETDSASMREQNAIEELLASNAGTSGQFVNKKDQNDEPMEWSSGH